MQVKTDKIITTTIMMGEKDTKELIKTLSDVKDSEFINKFVQAIKESLEE